MITEDTSNLDELRQSVGSLTRLATLIHPYMIEELRLEMSRNISAEIRQRIADGLSFWVNGGQLSLPEAPLLTAKEQALLSSLHWMSRTTEQQYGYLPGHPGQNLSIEYLRTLRLVHEINLLHLGLLDEDFNTGVDVRATEIHEIGIIDKAHLPVVKNEAYAVYLTALGLRRGVFNRPHDKTKTVNVNFKTPPIVKFQEIKLCVAEALASWKPSSIKDTDESILTFATCNWFSSATMGDVVELQRITPGECARFAFALMSATNPHLSGSLYSSVREEYREGLEKAVVECYNW